MVVYETYPPKNEKVKEVAEKMVVGETEVADVAAKNIVQPVKKKRKPADPAARSREAEQRRKAKNYEKDRVRGGKIVTKSRRTTN